MNQNSKAILVAIAIGLLALSTRWQTAGTFMTADEENWMIRSGQYYHNLFRNKDVGGAFMTTHPGATAMWVIGAGVTLQENRLGIDIDTSNISQFRRSATLPIVLVVSILISIITYALTRFAGNSVAIISGSLLALDPYLIGLSQIAHLDALLSLLMLASLVTFLLWGKKGQFSALGVSGVLAGLAIGTKLLAALWLGVFVGVYLLFYIVRKKYSWDTVIRSGMFFFGVAMMTFFFTWPALIKTDNVERSFKKDVPSVITDSHIELELSEDPIEPATFYARTVAGKTHPFVLILVLGVFINEVYRSAKKKDISDTLWIALFAIGFILLITYVAKKGDRYALPALVSFPVIIGLGLYQLSKYIPARGVLAVWKGHIVAALLVISVGAAALSWMPYTIAYASPMFPQNIRSLSQQGWGEAIDEAATWLNASPFIDRLYVASWYPDIMSTYFNGKALSLSSREDHRVGYVVLYRNMGGRANDTIASDVIDEFKDRVPEKIISINGEPYVWIYNVLGPYYFRQHVGELIGDMEVGQIIPVETDTWSRIDFAIATFSSRNNTQDVILEIRENIDDAEPIRTATVNATEIKDEEFQIFEFEPITNAKGKEYYVSLTSPQSSPGDAVTIRYVSEDVLPGQFVFRRNPLLPSEKRSDFIREGDLGYRIL